MNTDMFIHNTISDYNDIEYSLNDIFIETAMEADESVDDDTNKENFTKKIILKVEKLIKEIYAILDRFVNNISNIFTRIAQTDVGFRDHCRTAMIKNKPLEAIKLIAYDYNDQYLESQMSKVTTECLRILTSFKTEYQKESSVLDLKDKDINAYILSKIGCSSNITDLNLYFEELKKNFRVSKKEMLFKASLGKEYYNIAVLDIEKSKKVATEKQRVLKNQAGIIKSELSNITRNNTTQDNIKRRALQIYKNAGNVYNFFTSFIKIYIQFKIERALTYRVVLKKLFRFT